MNAMSSPFATFTLNPPVARPIPRAPKDPNDDKLPRHTRVRVILALALGSWLAVAGIAAAGVAAAKYVSLAIMDLSEPGFAENTATASMAYTAADANEHDTSQVRLVGFGCEGAGASGVLYGAEEDEFPKCETIVPVSRSPFGE